VAYTLDAIVVMDAGYEYMGIGGTTTEGANALTDATGAATDPAGALTVATGAATDVVKVGADFIVESAGIALAPDKFGVDWIVDIFGSTAVLTDDASVAIGAEGIGSAGMETTGGASVTVTGSTTGTVGITTEATVDSGSTTVALVIILGTGAADALTCITGIISSNSAIEPRAANDGIAENDETGTAMEVLGEGNATADPLGEGAATADVLGEATEAYDALDPTTTDDPVGPPIGTTEAL